MKIKSIRPTNKFAEIKFEEIIKDPLDKWVYTPSGFQPVLSCGFIKRGPTLKIITDGGYELICDPDHRLQVCSGYRLGLWSSPTEVFARRLCPEEDCLVSYNNQAINFTIEEGPVSDLYDIQLPAPHWWYTSGIVSHNSIMLCNNAITSYRGITEEGAGQNVLLVTFELDAMKTAMRCLAAAMADIPINTLGENQEYITRRVKDMQNSYQGKSIVIYELPPDECSVVHIRTIIDTLKRMKGWKPDVLIIDYLDLMMSRQASYNKDTYTRQKAVATEIRGLAKMEEVLIFTATQTNRGGAVGDKLVDMTSAAESFGKMFPLDYVIALSQSNADRAMSPPRVTMSISKNRNGPRDENICCKINYDTMLVKELM